MSTTHPGAVDTATRHGDDTRNPFEGGRPQPSRPSQAGQPSQPDQSWAAPRQVTLVRYDDYPSAERAVDALSDAGFPVARTSIVGRDVRTVEDVTGRVTTARATLRGAGAGLWFGLFVGLVLSLFTPGVFWLGALLTATAVGGVWGAVIGFVGHWSQRGRRDFDSVRRIEAGHYDITVDAGLAAEAARLLGLVPMTSRPHD